MAVAALLVLAAPALAKTSDPYRFKLPYAPFQRCATPEDTGCIHNPGIWAVRIGDVTGDGRDDLVLIPYGRELWIIPQREDGTMAFDAPRVFPYSLGPSSFVLGDLNGDGAQDVISDGGLGLSLDIVVLLSDGQGGHVERRVPSPFQDMHASWSFPVMRDVDGDGNLDLLYAAGGNFYENEIAARVYVHYGDGAGGFPRARMHQLADLLFSSMQLGDFDGDGLEDVALRLNLDGGPEYVLGISFNDGNEGFLPVMITEVPLGARVPGIGDFDGDGQDEITFQAGWDLYAATVSGPQPTRWTKIGPIAEMYPTATILTGDFDGNGRTDLYLHEFIPGYTGVYAVAHLNYGDEWIAFDSIENGKLNLPENESDHPNAIAAGDLDGDGCTDIASAHAGSGDALAIFYGLNCVPPVPTRDDFDGDGVSDLVWRHAQSGSNAIWLGADATVLQDVHPVRNTDWEIVAAGDFDGDGRADLFWRDRVTGANALWPAGAPSSTPVRTVSKTAWRVVGVGDFDGDGQDDLFWRNVATGVNAIWPSGHPGEDQVMGVTNLDWAVAGIGDFDGDRRSDVLWRNVATGQNVVWWHADYHDQRAVKYAPTDWSIVSVGDYDGDGRDDILWRNAYSGVNVAWRGADSNAVLKVTGVSDLAWQVAATGDYDGDGREDLFWRNGQTGANVIWRGADYGSPMSAARVRDMDWQMVPTLP